MKVKSIVQNDSSSILLMAVTHTMNQSQGKAAFSFRSLSLALFFFFFKQELFKVNRKCILTVSKAFHCSYHPVGHVL